MPVEVVWLTEERTYAFLITLGAYYSKVFYTRNGIDYEILVSNDDFEYLEDYAIDYYDED